MLIRFYNYYKLILVFCVYFHQWSLNFANGCLLLSMVFCVTCNSLSLLVYLCWKHLVASQFGIICPWPLIGVRPFLPHLAVASWDWGVLGFQQTLAAAQGCGCG